VLADPQRLGAVAAELVHNPLLARPRARLGPESGRAPSLRFAALRAHATAGELPRGDATVVELEAHTGSTELLHAELRGVALAALRTVALAATELAATPLDLAVVGLDGDGGVALDAPPARVASGVRRVTLADGSDALTVGLGTLYRARELVVLAVGEDTAEALRATLEEPPGPGSPASLLTDHPRITIIADRAAASRLTPRLEHASDRVLVVLGHREPGISAEHRISFESRARLRHARRLAQRHPYRAAILTGYTSTGGLSEAEQMKGARDEHVTPALLEVAGRNTAENASRSLPLILALGDVRRVVVVTSAWHLRTRYFFAPYREYGLDVAYRVSVGHGHWPRMLREELRGARRAPAQRAAAMAAMRMPR
jgi:glucosamine-6-phosphate deaminase